MRAPEPAQISRDCDVERERHDCPYTEALTPEEFASLIEVAVHAPEPNVPASQDRSTEPAERGSASDRPSHGKLLQHLGAAVLL